MSYSRKTTTVACWVAVLAAFFCSTASRAIAPTPMPLFSVQALDGATVSSSSWTLKGQSLFIFVRGNCRPCAALLGSLSKKDYPQLAGRTTIIVSDTGPEGAKALSQLYPDLSSATWYADSSKAAATALHLQGSPVVLGLKDNVVQWALSGVMQQPAQQKSILNTWFTK